MKDKRNARERLDALLTGLEDEVMRGEGCVDTDVEAMRAEIEALIEMHVGATRATSHAGDVKGKVTNAVELLGRWAVMGQNGLRSVLVPRVRMAFSGAKRGQDDRGSRKDRRGASDHGDEQAKEAD